jgi:thiamine biosynthesis lipoprotein
LWIARFRAMGSPCEVLVECESEAWARGIANAVAACAWRIEAKYSRYRGDGVIRSINAANGAPVIVDDETASLFDFAALMHKLSGGMFDITSGVLRRAWRFDGGRRVPTQAELDALLPLVGWNKVRWERPRIQLLPGMQIDLGGIGKEFAVDQATQTAGAMCEDAVLVNFGGDLAITRARTGGRPWRVGVEAAVSAPGQADKLIDLQAGALATSGDTYRFVESNGKRLPHILDPRDGRPVSGAPRSITVAAPTCTQAGMLTTLAMLQGTNAEEFLATENVRHWVQRD